MQNTVLENLFKVAFQGDYNIDKIRNQNLIALVGTTKAGKSTCQHWLVGKPLIGEVQKDGMVHYIPKASGGAISWKLGSATLVPNILSLNNKTALIDLAGFADNRNYVGVIGVSYMLRTMFDKAKNIKFIIVVEHDRIMSQTINYTIQPFVGFFKMFNYNNIMDQSTKKMLLESVSLIITKSSLPQKRYQLKINSIIEQLPKLGNVPYKNQSAQLFKHLIQNKKIQLFKEAEDGLDANQSKTLQNLEQRNWTYLNLQEFNFKYNQSLRQYIRNGNSVKNSEKRLVRQGAIKLPFSEDYNSLSQQQKNQSKQKISSRIKQIGKLIDILKKFIEKATKQKAYYNQNIQYQNQFKELKQQLDIVDVYQNSDQDYTSTITSMKNQIVANTTKQNIFGLQLIQKLQELYQILVSEDINFTQSGNFLQPWELIKKALNLFKIILSKNQEQQNLIIRVAFVIGMSIRQFTILYDVSEQLQNDFFYKIQQKIAGVFQRNFNYVKCQFISKMTPQVRKFLFNNVDDFLNYTNFIQSAFNTCQDGKLKIILKNQLLNIQKSKGQLLMKQHKYKQAISCFVKTNKDLQNYRQQQQIANDTQIYGNQNSITPYMQNVKQNVQNTKISIYKYIARCFQAINQYTKALKFYKYITFVESSIKCFQMIAKEKPQGSQKRQLLQDYAEYCLKQGRTIDAFKIYQRAFEQADNFNDRQEIKKKLSQLLLNKDASEEDYCRNLRNLKLTDTTDPIKQLEEMNQLDDQFIN